MSVMSAIARHLPPSIKARLKRLLSYPSPYVFMRAHSIKAQRFQFEFWGRQITIEAGFDTPVYETIAEVVDHDCYQLRQLPIDRWTAPLIVDIGANIGLTACCMGQWTGSSIVCVEPVPQNCQSIAVNAATNKLDNITVIQAALGATDGAMPFWVPADETVSGKLANATAQGNGFIDVRTITLSTLFNTHCADRNIDLLKIDCEGGEYDIANQITPTLASRIHNITFEIHDQGRDRNVKTITRQLEALGYTVHYKPDLFGRPYLHHLLATRRQHNTP